MARWTALRTSTQPEGLPSQLATPTIANVLAEYG
jgi:hypothetical protein